MAIDYTRLRCATVREAVFLSIRQGHLVVGLGGEGDGSVSRRGVETWDDAYPMTPDRRLRLGLHTWYVRTS